MGLSAFEYQCGHGVRTGEKTARAFGKKAVEHGIAISVHAPYFISLAGDEDQKRENSLGYILQSARLLDWLGGERLVLHPGGAGKGERDRAMALAADTLRSAIKLLDSEHLGHIRLCPETMGKHGQLGSLEEILDLCALDERLLPCVDFGHLNARSAGGCVTREQMDAVLDALENALGKERARVFHAHFSKIEYTQKGGEVRHLTFADNQYGPSFEPLACLLRIRDMHPTIICESRGTQIADAAAMSDIYSNSI